MAHDADLGDKLTQLAEVVLDEMLDTDGEPTSLEQRIDAIKAIGSLYLGLRRVNGKVPEEADEPSGLPAMRKRIQEAEKGK